MQKKYGLVGFPLSHTFSPGFFKNKFEEENIADTSYEAFELESIDLISELFKDSFLKGLNVTIPYKESVIEFLDELSPAAAEIRAVNTIKFIDGKTIGYNTDVMGFEISLQELLAGASIDNALVLGSGGAAKAVRYVLSKMGIDHKVVSRSDKGDISYSDIEGELHKYPLIINTSPLGMYPNLDTCPQIPYEEISKNHFFFDLIYNPEKTLFLKQAEAKGAKITNGHRMLIIQAEKSWEIWNRIQ